MNCYDVLDVFNKVLFLKICDLVEIVNGKWQPDRQSVNRFDRLIKIELTRLGPLDQHSNGSLRCPRCFQQSSFFKILIWSKLLTGNGSRTVKV